MNIKTLETWIAEKVASYFRAQWDQRRQGRYRPQFVEALEGRTLLTAVLVNNSTDDVNGDTSSITALQASDGGDGISLREAIEATNSTAGADEINFDAALAGSVITLGGSNLLIEDAVSIHGLGADQLTVDADGNSRVFNITDSDSATQLSVEISGLKITGGQTNGNGAGIRTFEDLTLRDSVVTGNTAPGDHSRGGGIYNRGGNTQIIDSTVSYNYGYYRGGGIYNGYEDTVLTITGSVVTNNTSAQQGGGIYNINAALTLQDSSITENTANKNAGGIDNAGTNEVTTLTIIGSTFSGNSATNSGGAIRSTGGKTLTIVNSTFSGNMAGANGGAILSNGNLTLLSSTLTQNIADADNSGDGTGGALFSNSVAVGSITNTIIAGNTNRTDGMATADDFSDGGAAFTITYNILGDGTGNSVVDGVDNNQVGVDVSTVLNTALADNGGSTLTHLLLTGSSAIDAGTNTLVTEFADQRALFRILDGTVDIGAVEVPQEGDFQVDTLDDNYDGDLSTGQLSLREAIALANGNPDTSTISFDAGLSGGTITLSGTELEITQETTITGLGADLLTIDANDLSRVFLIDDGDNGSDLDVAISGLTMTGGRTSNADTTTNAGRGGGIHTYENLTLTSVLIENNVADSDGGGIWSRYGDVTLIESTVSGNTAKFYGGGLYSRSNTVEITNSTFSGNTLTAGNAGVSGGAIYGTGNNVSISNSTITGNSARRGGGLYGVDTLSHTIVAGNSATTGPNVFGSISAEWSLIENDTDATISGSNNVTGVDPLLEALGNYGGPTPTHALQAGSPALNAGDPSAVAGSGDVPLTDQRGFARVDATRVDIGAVEHVAVESLVVTTLVDEDDSTSDPHFGTGTSLREALAFANSDPDANTITFDDALVGGTIALEAQLSGNRRLEISEDVMITGPGADNLTINGNFASQIFYVGSATVSLSGLTLTGGGAFDLNADTSISMSLDDTVRGGAVFNDGGTLTLSEMKVTVNIADDSGGGLYNQGGMLTVKDSTLSFNTSGDDGGAIYTGASGTTIATGSLITENEAGNGVLFPSGDEGEGGGLHLSSGTLSITDSTVSDNTALTYGGGVSNAGGDLTITRSTIVGNTVLIEGGGVNTGPDGGSAITQINDSTISGNSATFGGGVNNGSGLAPSSTTIVNSTISGNEATEDGGGIQNFDDTLVVVNSTIFDNRADADGDGSGIGGGLWTFDDDFTFSTLVNTIVVGNLRELAADEVADDISEKDLTDDSTSNVIGDAATSGISGTNTNPNAVGVSAASVLDTTLADNGGPTLTHALVVGSIAVDAGDSSLATDDGTIAGTPLEVDQRGIPRVIGQVDVGAVESVRSLVVDTADDESDGDYTAGDMSLREAVELANLTEAADTMTFVGALTGETITLGGTRIDIFRSVTITGPGASNLTIDGDDTSQIFSIDGVIFGNTLTVEISGLTLTNGRATTPGDGQQRGGLVTNMQTVTTITDSVLSSSIADRGGALFVNATSTLILDSTEVRGNQAQRGGGLFNHGTVSLTGSTLSGNMASLSGGGLFQLEGMATITDSTLHMNSANVHGGGLYLLEGSILITGSTLSQNSASRGGGIYNRDLLQIETSTLSGNTSNTGGGGIFNTYSGSISITQSTFSANTAQRGGGLNNYGATQVVNSTFSGNSVTGHGGAIENSSMLDVLNSTITGNFANNDLSGGGSGGGIRTRGPGQTLLKNTIVAGNLFNGGSADDDLFGAVAGSSSNNLIGDAGSAGGLMDGANGNIVGVGGTGVRDINTILNTTLADNGGSTFTHLLVIRSAALNAGDNDLVAGLLNDQRGIGFVRVRNGQIDIGSIEGTV